MSNVKEKEKKKVEIVGSYGGERKRKKKMMRLEIQ